MKRLITFVVYIVVKEEDGEVDYLLGLSRGK